MSCEIARRLVESGDAGLRLHTESCLSCAIGEQARYYEAPAGLEEKIRTRLRAETHVPVYRQWWAAAAVVVLAVAGGVGVDRMVSRGSAIETAVLSAHLRSLEGTHLFDVPSSDQHTVKPWFDGKLDFSPSVPTFPDFPLLGGRLEYVAGHPAAALIYGRAKHVINLFVWRSAEGSSGGTTTKDGYHFVSWSANGMDYEAVSDVNAAELERFASLYRGAM